MQHAEGISENPTGNVGTVALFLGVTHLNEQQQTGVADLVDGFVADSGGLAGAHDALPGIESELAAISRAEGRAITPASEDATRLFCGLLFNRLSDLERGAEPGAAQSLASRMYEELFSSSPNAASYSGSPDKQFRLLALAQATPLARDLSRPATHELAYSVSFGYRDDIFVEMLQADSPVEQLQAMQTLKQIGIWAEGNGEWAEPAVRKAVTAFAAAASDEQNSALIRAVAAANVRDLQAEWVDLEDVPAAERQRLMRAHTLRQADSQRRQTILAQQFPDLAKDGTSLVAVAKDCAATWRGDGLGYIQQGGIVASSPVFLDTVRGTPALGLDAQQSKLLSELHRPMVRNLVEEKLGISLADISLTAQVRLLQYMVSAQTDVYNRLGATLQSVPPNSRVELAESFLATEYGDDLADSILTITENAELETTKEVFGIVGRYREYATSFGAMFRPYDPAFAEATTKAMTERLTDGVAAIEALVEARNHHIRLDLGVGGTYAADLEEGLEALRLAEQSLRIQHDVFADPAMRASRVTEENQQFAIYRLTSEQHGEVLLYVRPEGAKGYDRRFEYGNARGVEASISFITNPVPPHHLRSDKDPNGVSFRFDREGRVVGESPFSEDRDPTRERGSVSLDISSVLGNPDKPAARIGRFFAVGNLLRARKTGGKESLHHNNNFFDQEIYGSGAGFKGLAEYVMRVAEAAVATSDRRRVGGVALATVRPRVSHRQVVGAAGRKLAA